MMQQFSRAQAALLGGAATPTPFHWLEWVVIALGGGFWALGLSGANVASSAGGLEPDERAWFLATVGLAVAVLVLFAFTSRRAISEGLAMHADPSPDRIAPYSGAGAE